MTLVHAEVLHTDEREREREREVVSVFRCVCVFLLFNRRKESKRCVCVCVCVWEVWKMCVITYKEKVSQHIFRSIESFACFQFSNVMGCVSIQCGPLSSLSCPFPMCNLWASITGRKYHLLNTYVSLPLWYRDHFTNTLVWVWCETFLGPLTSNYVRISEHNKN